MNSAAYDDDVIHSGHIQHPFASVNFKQIKENFA
jgi:hypothetical protein